MVDPLVMRVSSLYLRLLAVLALGVGFYALLVCLLLAAFLLPVLELRYFGRLHLVLVGGPFAVVALMWGARPRRHRFEPPGPELAATEHPELFDLIERVAVQTRQAAPTAVYLVPEVNVFVASVGGVLGMRQRRVLGVGLPALQLLDEEELRAVIAHEFGHFAGGDTHFARLAFGLTRSVRSSLSRPSPNLAWHLVNGYFKLLLRSTTWVLREQEKAADELAANVTSRVTMASALWRMEHGQSLFEAYLTEAAGPVLTAGYVPDLRDGFDRFRSTQQLKAPHSRMERRDAGRYDTHPPLAERLAMLGFDLSFRPSSTFVASPASSYLRPSAAETNLWPYLIGEGANDLDPVEWDRFGEIQIEAWRCETEQQRELLVGLRLGDLPRDIGPWSAMGRVVLGRRSGPVGHRNWHKFGHHMVARAMAVALHDAGWIIRCEPGEILTIEHDGQKYDPVDLLDGVVDDDAARIGFEKWVRRYGLGDLALVSNSEDATQTTNADNQAGSRSDRWARERHPQRQ
ncbi:MAG: M48 family metallopeptidase [Acidimicrobiales bacterium]